MRAYAEALWGSWKQSDTLMTLDITDHEIILDQGQACGCIAVTWHPEYMFVEKLYIDPAFQGRGIGALALKIKTDFAAAKGLPTKLSVLTTNPADRFYQREGFTLESETSERRLFVKSIL